MHAGARVSREHSTGCQRYAWNFGLCASAESMEWLHVGSVFVELSLDVGNGR